ncbi:MAG: polysaccharide deacetylase family protein [Lyngbya sp.]|nr:polysaccharide deacetylase family protein [Lyngbya sp.]
MVQNPSLRRLQQQQQRITRLALISAVGSFMIGVMLPWNLRTTRQVVTPSVPRSSPQMVTPSPESPETPEKKSSPDEFVPPVVDENSSSPTSETENREEGQQSNLPAVPSSGINPQELPPVGQAIAQRAESVQTAITRLKAQRFDNTIPDRFKGKTVKYVDLNTDEKVIALTFDDGPWPTTTEQILDILRENNIKATFFWVGQALNNFKEIGQKVAADGHVIANHTWNHRYHYHNHSAAAKEIEDTANLIEELIGVQTTIFRPPGGVEDNGLVNYAFTRDYVNIMWSSDSKDWRSSASSIKQNVLSSAKPGRIVLLHDGGGNRAETVKALPDIIAELKGQGYRFVTIPELLEIADQHIAKQESQVQQQSSLEINSDWQARE